MCFAIRGKVLKRLISDLHASVFSKFFRFCHLTKMNNIFFPGLFIYSGFFLGTCSFNNGKRKKAR